MNQTSDEKSTLDCGDSGCYFAPRKGGMRTNGGCRCFVNAGFGKSLVSAAREMLPELLHLRAAAASRPCGFCGGVAREPTMAEEFIGAVAKTVPNITMRQLAELGARLGIKARVIWTEMSADEKAAAARLLHENSQSQPKDDPS